MRVSGDTDGWVIVVGEVITAALFPVGVRCPFLLRDRLAACFTGGAADGEIAS